MLADTLMGLVSEIYKIQSLGNKFSMVFYYFLPFTIEIIYVFYIKIAQNFMRNLLQIVEEDYWCYEI